MDVQILLYIEVGFFFLAFINQWRIPHPYHAFALLFVIHSCFESINIISLTKGLKLFKVIKITRVWKGCALPTKIRNRLPELRDS